MNLEEIPYIMTNVIWRVVDNKAVLVSPEGGQVTILNNVGTNILSLIDGQNRGIDIAQQLVQQYDVTINQAQQDVDMFLTRLSKKGLVTWEK